MKKRISILSSVLALALLVSCGSTGGNPAPAPEPQPGGDAPAPAPAAPTLVIRIASEQTEDNPRTLALYEFEKEVEAASGGAIDVQNFPNSLLGTEEEYMESTIAGEIEMCTIGSSIANRFPKYAALSVPFLIKSYEDADRVLSSDYCQGEYLDGFTESTNMHFLAYSTYGFRDIGSTVMVEQISDFAPLRFRNNGSQQQIAIVENWGSNPVSFPMGELYTAIEQKSVDIFELPLTSILSSKFYEIAPYVIQSNHTLDLCMLGMNEDFWQSLTDDQKAIIEEASANYQKNVFLFNQQKAEEIYGEIEANGGIVVKPSDAFMKELIDAQSDIDQVLDEIFPGSGDAIAKLRQIADS